MNADQIKSKINRDIEAFQSQKQWTGKYQLTSKAAGLALTDEEKDNWIMRGGREKFVDAAIEFAQSFQVTEDNAAEIEKTIERGGIIALYNAKH